MGSRIGFFDSGIGGLDVVEGVLGLMPDLPLLYVGDTARVPYGGLDPDTLLRYATQAIRYLFAHHCDLVVFACNTVSVTALPRINKACCLNNTPTNGYWES